MIPRLNISFPLENQKQFWFGKAYSSQAGEYLLNHARSGIVMALRTTLPHGGKVGVVAYNCHTVANAVVQSGCTPVRKGGSLKPPRGIYSLGEPYQRTRSLQCVFRCSSE